MSSSSKAVSALAVGTVIAAVLAVNVDGASHSGVSLTSRTAYAQYNTPPGGATATPPQKSTQGVSVTTLVTAAVNPDIVNAWGLAFNGTSGPAWLADNGTGKSSVYDAGNALQLTVTVPPVGGAAQAAPTGIAWNGNAQAFGGDNFVFVSEDGAVTGWQPSNGGAAVVRVDRSGAQAIYKGATIGATPGGPRLYAANFHGGGIDVFDGNYQPVNLAAGAFVDPALPANYAPFNVRAVGERVYVTYAMQSDTKTDDLPGVGLGILDVYNLDGTFLARLAADGGPLNAPWGITPTPAQYGKIPGRLLIGNFGDGRINVYNLDSSGLAASFEGQIVDTAGDAIVIPGLWALEFPPALGGFSATQLYFTAGPADEKGGAYGKLDLLP